MDVPAGSATNERDVAQVTAALTSARSALAEVIRGKERVLDLTIIALVSGGHLLLEDIPGVGKSTLARTLAQIVGGSFRRIQFTSDLLPADLVGVNVWKAGESRFEFRPGPVFANLVLADEINRSPPRTQSALLEAMGEQQVSVDGVSHPLPAPFMVIATQNPLEHYGTYPLPESQRDRFVFRIRMGYVDAEVEANLLASGGTRHIAELSAAIEGAQVLAAQVLARGVFVHADLARYAQQVVQRTREAEQVELGVSTRGALAWMAAARARAFLDGRQQVSIDDLQELAIPALAHRIVPSRSAGADQSAVAEEILRDLLAGVAVPV